MAPVGDRQPPREHAGPWLPSVPACSWPGGWEHNEGIRQAPRGWRTGHGRAASGAADTGRVASRSSPRSHQRRCGAPGRERQAQHSPSEGVGPFRAAPGFGCGHRAGPGPKGAEGTEGPVPAADQVEGPDPPRAAAFSSVSPALLRWGLKFQTLLDKTPRQTCSWVPARGGQARGHLGLQHEGCKWHPRCLTPFATSPGGTAADGPEWRLVSVLLS